MAMTSLLATNCTQLVSLLAFRPQSPCNHRMLSRNSYKCRVNSCFLKFTLTSRQRKVSLLALEEQATEEGDAAAPIDEAEVHHETEMNKLYGRETPVITALLEAIDERNKVNETVEDVLGEETTEEEKREVIREVVDENFDQLSEGILVVLAGYAQAAYGGGHNDVAETLEMLREEILERSKSQLPAELQALDELSESFDLSSEQRVAIIEQIAAGSYLTLPGAELGALRTTASQMLEDLEEKESIMDRRLLARLCVIREEVDVAASNAGFLVSGSEYHQLMNATWRLLPLGPAAFIKELIPVASPQKRLALLEACIRRDFEGEAAEASSRRWRAEGVRPGRLMNTLAALLTGLAQKGLQPDSQEVVRLQEIKAAALAVLTDLAT